MCIMSLYCILCIQTASSPQTRLITSPPVKKIKRVNGYNLFFSDTVRSGPEISTGTCTYMYTYYTNCCIEVVGDILPTYRLVWFVVNEYYSGVGRISE